jgi:hypothetical protein
METGDAAGVSGRYGARDRAVQPTARLVTLGVPPLDLERLRRRLPPGAVAAGATAGGRRAGLFLSQTAA